MIGLLRYCHFALPCSSWGRANQLNGGTRSVLHPEGSSSPLEREVLGNFQAELVVDICILINACHAFFTIENLADSHFWRSKFFAKLKKSCDVHVVDFCQCAYGLRLPGAPRGVFCRKCTRVASNDPRIVSLARRCPGVSASHRHEHAWGSRKVRGTTIKLAAAAGAYPEELCNTLARFVMSCLSA